MKTAEDEVGRAVLAATLGISEREISNLVKDHVDFPSIQRGKRSRVFPLRQCVHWYVRFKSAEAVKRAKPATTSDVEEMRRRRAEAEMKLMEMDVADREGRLVSVDQVDRVVGEVCDRLRAAIVNMPGNYGLKLEELGLAADVAEATLTQIAEELTQVLRGTADDLEMHGDDATSDDTAAAD